MTMKVPFLDLRIEDEVTRRELLNAIETVFLHGRFIMGPEIAELEKRVAAYLGRNYAVGVNSGTDALLLGMKALGIGPGDEVITTPLSWIATVNAIALTGATPVFADIRADLNIDPATVEPLITPKTKAILPVHYTGKIAPMSELLPLAQRHRLLLIEDAAQAFGASLNGQLAGSFGDMACFSMNPMKVFSACGEAGMVVTDRKEVYEKLIALRYNGMINLEQCQQPGLNGRLDTLQAAILLTRLPKVEAVVAHRRQIAAVYTRHLAKWVVTPQEKPGEIHGCYTYTIQTDRRDELKQFLEAHGIEAKVRDRYLIPSQPAYQSARSDHYPVAQQLIDRLLALPIHEKMTMAQADYVIAAVAEFFNPLP